MHVLCPKRKLCTISSLEVFNPCSLLKISTFGPRTYNRCDLKYPPQAFYLLEGQGRIEEPCNPEQFSCLVDLGNSLEGTFGMDSGSSTTMV